MSELVKLRRRCRQGRECSEGADGDSEKRKKHLPGPLRSIYIPLCPSEFTEANAPGKFALLRCHGDFRRFASSAMWLGPTSQQPPMTVAPVAAHTSAALA